MCCPVPTRQGFVAKKSLWKDALEARFTSPTGAMVCKIISKRNSSTVQKRVYLKNRASRRNQLENGASDLSWSAVLENQIQPVAS